MVLSDLCAIQGWQNVLGSLECTHEDAGYLSRDCIVITWAFPYTAGLESQSLETLESFGLPVYKGLCTRLNRNSARAWFIKTCVASQYQSIK